MLSKRLFLLVLGINAVASVSLADTTNLRLHVSGSGVETLPATLAQVSLGVRVSGQEAGPLQKKLKDRNNRIMSFLRKKKVNHLKTRNYELETKTYFVKGKQKNDGFEGRATIDFSVPIDQAGELLDSVFKHGADEIKRVRFTARAKELDGAQKKALNKASKKALDKGKHVLKSLGLQYVGIDEISVGHHRPAPRNQKHLMLARTSSSPAVELEAGDVEIQANVNLILKYK